ncbi:MAG: hypothetical protein E6Q97_34195 [Desulfurellales bacterium]|nr:MAG: hypothetical protein E6Q97_34195 [Desulfurellales bacterium]
MVSKKKPAKKAAEKKTAAKPEIKAAYKEKAKPDEKTAAPAAVTETQEQKDRIVARLMADHGYTLTAATQLVENSRASKKGGILITHEEDHVRTIKMNFHPRAGITSYTVEMHERLKDIEDEKNRVFYVLPIRLPKKLYNFLLKDALSTAENADYTEENHVHAILTERMALSGLTSPKASE